MVSSLLLPPLFLTFRNNDSNLEINLISYPGLPPPFSFDLPVECESILRSQNVVPATIAILNGRIKVGLTTSDLAQLAELGFQAKKDGGAKLWKVGRRELGAAVVKVSFKRIKQDEKADLFVCLLLENGWRNDSFCYYGCGSFSWDQDF